MKTKASLLLLTLLIMALSVTVFKAEGSSTLELTPTETNHVIELNSNQPYVAGFHVNTEDLSTREVVNATAITVSFPSTDPSLFPHDSWLGGGMFVQAQDTRFRHVDYAFYTMLVLDASGNLFVDVGLHQTREGTLPLQMPTEEFIYAYTWQIHGTDFTTPTTLLARWDSDRIVRYSISTPEHNETLISIDVVGFPNCENMIPKFYAGNVIVEPFPFSRYVNYFQFGVVSSENIPNNHWNVNLREPKMLRKAGWAFVDKAWTVHGDIAYLDLDWKWGGAPYHGVNAKYYQNPLEDPYEVIFFYNGSSLARGTVLWDYRGLNEVGLTWKQPHFTKASEKNAHDLWINTALIICAVSTANQLHKLKQRCFWRDSNE